ncbi:unnamed protein product [Rhizophagus irregularis]|nr:unnamed protein product [Rhizophagus irregularis]
MDGKELKWCQHSIPNLKKAHKPKAKNTLNKNKSGNTGKALESNKPKKKDKISSSKLNEQNSNQSKHPSVQKKAKNTSKNKDHNKTTRRFLAEILSLLRKLV